MPTAAIFAASWRTRGARPLWITRLQGFVALLLTAACACHAYADESIRADPERMQARIEALGQFGTNPEGGVSRVAFSDADLAGREWLKREMRSLGLEVRVDAAGNIIGRRAGEYDAFPAILFGSHIDSVPGGGNYDGQVGVVGALEVISLLNEYGITTRHPLEVVSFTDEEGGLTGSRALIGSLTDDAMQTVSNSGYSIAEGIVRVGGDPSRIASAARDPATLRAFLELHIEQGAFLDEAEVEIGIVEGIVGIRWWDVTVEGVANHGGTTPMNRRNDALLGAAELALAINRLAREMPGRQVATVGRIEAFPGAPNVIPGKTVMSLEIRDLDSAKMQTLYRGIVAEGERIAETRGLSIGFDEIDTASPPAPTDIEMRDLIEASTRALGYSAMRMPSGAGHDAQDLATITPTGMIFVPSRGGVSHSPREYTAPDAMARGASVLLGSILALDRQQ